MKVRKFKFFQSFIDFLKDSIFVYETPKVVLIHSIKIGSLFRVFQIGILVYFITWVMIKEKGYQKFDTAISGVTTKVKGVAWTHLPKEKVQLAGGPRVWDSGDYSIPPQQNSGFFVVTKISALIEQKLGTCAETHALRDARCRRDEDCPKGETAGKRLNNNWDKPPENDEIDVDLTGHGVFTGKCLKETKTCEIFAWCPIYDEEKIDKQVVKKINQDALSDSYSHERIELRELIKTMRMKNESEENEFGHATNFTVYIKNSIEFPYFGVKRCNILPSMSDDFVENCVYDENDKKSKYCPRFRLGYIIEKAGAHEKRLLKHGGVIAITIDWECDLDKSDEACLPKYGFKQIDSPPDESGTMNDTIPLRPGEGWKVEYSYHYGVRQGDEDNRRRMLAVVNGIQFLVRSTGKAGKFNIINFTMNCGSVMALFGGGTIVCDLILLNLLRDKHRYRQAVKDCKLMSDHPEGKTPKVKKRASESKTASNKSISINSQDVSFIKEVDLASRPQSLISTRTNDPPAIMEAILSPKLY